jgi:hypothetical protein
MKAIIPALVLMAGISPAFRAPAETQRDAQTSASSTRELQTMRIDYVHRGGPAGESVRLDRVLADGPWAGSVTKLIDDTNLGEYFFEVVDVASGRPLFSRGFSSIYAEWETIPEAKTRNRSFHESLRFPWPGGPVRVTLKKRGAENIFRDLWSTSVDPRSVNPRTTAPPGQVTMLLENGPPQRKVDLLLISDGYDADELPTFRLAAERLIKALLAMEPFRGRRSDFNVRLLERPGSPAAVEFNVFGIERYALSSDNRALRNLASGAPYDIVGILTNEAKYGGGGIFNQQFTVAAGSKASEYVFIHELAHHLAGLADEYIGNVTYETGSPRTVEPWEPNLTALLAPATLKWRDLIEAGTPLPTPMTYAGKVGAFEGGGYESRGVYRPEVDCLMGSRTSVPFCRVCQRAISRAIDLYVQ